MGKYRQCTDILFFIAFLEVFRMQRFRIYFIITAQRCLLLPNHISYIACHKLLFMNKHIINTPQAPAPIGPYNQAVLVNDTLFISGQIPIDPATGELNNATLQDETDQCMKNLQAILSDADMSFDNVVKSTIFITDMHRFAEINEVYGRYFSAAPPARETVQVAALPKFVNVEISMIAIK